MEVVVVLSSRIGIFVNGSFTFNVVDSKEEDDDVKSSLAFFILTFDGNCLWMIGWNDFLGKEELLVRSFCCFNKCTIGINVT